jgi:Asp/Glu/hydantoin racemase
MRLANIVSPGAEHLVPPATVVGSGSSVENVVLRADIPLAVDPLRLALKEIVYVEAAVRAESQGFDAVFVNTVADYGLALIASTLRIPVVGAGEASVDAAAGRGQSFSFVTVWPSSTKGHYERLLRATGAEERCVSIRYVTTESELPDLGGARGVMGAITSDVDPLADRVLEACVDAIKVDGADTIILGCTCMTGLSAFLEAALGQSIIDPLVEGCVAAELAARGADPLERRALTPLDVETRRQVTAAATALVSADSADETCPVCPLPTS